MAQHGTTLSQGSGSNGTAKVLCIFPMKTSVVSVQSCVVMLAFELSQLVVTHGMTPHGSSQNNTVTILCIFLMEASIVSAHITYDDLRLVFELSQLVAIAPQTGYIDACMAA